MISGLKQWRPPTTFEMGSLQEVKTTGRLYLRKPERTYAKILAIFEYLKALYLQTYLTKRGQNPITTRHGKES